MAQSYKNFKQNLNENELTLLEIGELVQPYDTGFVFSERGNTITTDFKDHELNLIKVLFHRFKEGSNSFELEFTINNHSAEAFKTDLKHFFKIISTVVQATNEFIEKYQPINLSIEGFDKVGKEGQKNNIWLQYAKVNLKADDYTLGVSPKGFGLQRK